ncbi:MAG: glycosyltransferase, partial [Candidatus Micrarchaeaceae archaeon]
MILHITIEVLKGDAISDIVQTQREINVQNNDKDTIILTQSSQIKAPYIKYADLGGMSVLGIMQQARTQNTFSLMRRFIGMQGKAKFLKSLLVPKPKPDALLSSACLRIWHVGIYYKLMEMMEKRDIMMFYGLNDEALSLSPSAITTTRNRLKELASIRPFAVAESRYAANQLNAMGYESVTILPLYHHYDDNMDYIWHPHATPHLIAWGRYAKNKAIPELVRECAASKLPLTVFGDNTKYAEFKEEYRKATLEADQGIRLYGKQDTFEELLKPANIYICNSYNEGFNMPLIEAEAHSLPVLARRGTAMDELVEDGYNGYLFDDISEVPELVAKIMQRYRAMSYNAFLHSDNYTLEKYEMRYLR